MEKLRKWLTQTQIQHAEFANMIGITPETLCRLLAGKQNIGLKTMRRVYLLTDGLVDFNDMMLG